MFSKRLAELRHRVRYTCAGFPKSQEKASSSQKVVLQGPQLHHLHPIFGNVRYASTTSVVPPVITKAFEAASPVGDNATRSSTIDSLIESIGPIPEAPGLPGPKVLDILANGEASLESLGLAGWSPPGLLQKLLELVHVSGDLSWGTSIVIVAVVARALLFKVLIRQRQESAKFAAVMPQLQFLQQKITEARQRNDLIQASRYGMELAEFSKQGISPFSTLKFAAVQAFVLISFTQALRQMCNLPVESLQTGGYLSFVDLTMSDPTYTLPIVNALLLYLHLVSGKEIHQMFPNKPYLVHAGMLGMSVFVFAIGMNFPSAIVLYWISSLAVTVIQHKILAHPKVKQYYNLTVVKNSKIADMMKMESLKKKKKKSVLGFWAQFKESQVNNRLAAEVKRRAEIDSAAFERAGREPIRKTYKYDVTKVKK